MHFTLLFKLLKSNPYLIYKVRLKDYYIKVFKRFINFYFKLATRPAMTSTVIANPIALNLLVFETFVTFET
jgi:hypothetical protein